jgi:ABC-type oligopeptide transport system substrate-binding subunit
MRRTLLVGLAVLGLALTASAAAAQGQRWQGRYTPRRPTVTPYLNLFRGGASIGENYYRLVQPEFEWRDRTAYQQQEINRLQGDLQQAETQLLEQTGVRPTGHASYFLDYGGYYPSRRGGRGQR